MTGRRRYMRRTAPGRQAPGWRAIPRSGAMLAGLLGIVQVALPGIAMAQSATHGEGQMPAPVCVTRISDPDMIAMPGDHTLIAWLTVRQPVVVSIRASGFADGDKLGRLSVSVLQDGTMLAQSPEERGTGKLDAGVTTTAALTPGRQYRFVARPDSRDTQLRQLRLHIVSDASCG